MAMDSGWADLPQDILTLIADGLTIDSHACVRAVCTNWRSLLRPAAPSLLAVLYDAEQREGGWRLCALCLSPKTSTVLKRRMATMLCLGSRCVGSGDGWLAIDDPILRLVNPLTDEEIPLYSFTRGRLSKVVIAPNPKQSNFTAAAITGRNRLIYTTAGNNSWADVQCPRLADGDGLTDVMYHEKAAGKKVVYCLTRHGDVHIVHLPGDRGQQRPAVVEPLLSKNFDKGAAFAAPYNTISKHTSAKNLVFCNGNLYQIWRNTSCTVTSQLPSGGRCRVLADQIFVLRYYPRRRPCWNPVKELGGCSVFVGMNNAISLHVKGDNPGVRGNCVYWIGGQGRNMGMEFDMETGTSTPCFPGIPLQRDICWYHLGDTRSSNSHNLVTPAYRLRKRTRRA
uniref:Uncharacterized protein n=1 Tax=Oryza punctata TaxID=4537 RepID=A0A0E0LQW3_ORYPU